MALDVGINVVEVNGRAAPTLLAAPTSVAAFIGITQRGVPDRPVRVSDVGQFRAQFGRHRPDALLAYAVEGFFQNGGAEAWVSRAVGPGTVPASVNLLDRAAVPAPALRLQAGYRGALDPGTWGESIRVDVRDDPWGSTTVALGTGANAVQAVLTSVSGFEIGRVVRFTDGTAVSVRRITGVDAAARTVSWTGPIVAGLNAGALAATAEFRLVVQYRTAPTAEFEVVEEFRRLTLESRSTDYAVARINHPLTGSRYLFATDLTGTSTTGVDAPAVVSARALGAAAESAPTAAELSGDPAARTGLYALDPLAVQLLAIPDAHLLAGTGRASVVNAALAYCAARGDCTWVGAGVDRGRAAGVTVPRVESDYNERASDYARRLQADAAPFQASKVYGALYAPWIQVQDPIGPGPAPTRFVPPDGHVMGVYARTDLERGVWKAPAGSEALVRGALDVAATFTDGQHTALVQEALVNGIRPQAGLGITVAASRTLSTDTRWWFVPVRLLFNFVKATLRDGLRFVRQEPHSEALRRMVRLNVVTPFLLGLWRRGAFGSGAPGGLFTVKCDAENNPPSEVDQGNFRIEVYFYPVRPAETVVIVVGQQPSGASAAEA